VFQKEWEERGICFDCLSTYQGRGIGLGGLVAGIGGYYPAGGMDVLSCVCMLCCSVSVEAFDTS
jgi:hypothetical protein